MSSQPNPVYVEFAVKDIEKVLSTMKTLEDALLRVEKRSAAVQKLAVNTTAEATKQAKAAVEGASKASTTATAAARNGNKKVLAEAEKEYRAFVKQIETISKNSTAYAGMFAAKNAKAELDKAAREFDKFSKHVDSIKEKSATYAGKFASQQAKSEGSARDKAYSKFSSRYDSIKEKSATGAGSFAEQQVKADRALERAIYGAKRDIKRGELAGSPELSATNRLRGLERARGLQNPEDIHAAIDKAKELKADNQAVTGGARLKSRFELEKKAAEDSRALWSKLGTDIGAANYKADQHANKMKLADGKRTAAELKSAYDKATKDYNKAVSDRKRGRDEAWAPVKSAVGNFVGGLSQRAVRTLTSIPGQVANHLLNAGGGASFDAAVQDNLDFETTATLVANKAPGGARPKREVMEKSRVIAAKYGISRTAAAKAYGAYVDKAGAPTMKAFRDAGENVEFAAKYAKAAGLDPTMVATVMGKLKDQNPDLAPKDMKQLSLDILEQSKEGSVDMDDLIGSVKGFSKTASFYSGDMSKNQSRLLGMAQVVAGNEGTAREGATSVSNIARDTNNHAGVVGAFLPGSLTKDGKIAKPVDEYVGDILEKSHGNVHTLKFMGSDKQVFGNKAMDGLMAAMVPFAKERDKALAAGADEATANKAGRKGYDDFVKTKMGKGYSEDELDKDFAAVMATSAEQFEGAVRELKKEVGDKLVPVLIKFIPVLEKTIPVLARLLDVLGKALGVEDKVATPDQLTEGTKAPGQVETLEDLGAGRGAEEEHRKEIARINGPGGVRENTSTANLAKGILNDAGSATLDKAADLVVPFVGSALLRAFTADGDSSTGEAFRATNVKNKQLDEQIATLTASLERLQKGYDEAAVRIGATSIRQPTGFTRDDPSNAGAKGRGAVPLNSPTQSTN